MTQQQQQLGTGAVGVQILGDGNSVTIAGAASLVLTRFKDLRGPGRDDSPAARLTAVRRLTEFVGRQVLRDRLTGWLDGAEQLEVRTLTGEGGSGKTRLALELCDQRHQAGWATGFVTRSALERFIRQPTPCWRWDRPVLAVIDYAASWGADLRDWLAELAAQNPEHPIRVLLLERGLGEWHEKLFAPTDSVGQTIRHKFGWPVVEPLDRIDKDAAVTLFDATYRHETGRDPRHGPGFRESLAGKDWGGRPLFVMAAASRAAQETIPDALALTRRDLVDHIAARELARLNWVPAEKFCAHCVAAITLRGGLSKDQARDMIAAERTALARTDAPHPNDLLPILGDATRDFRPIEPDMIGGAVMLKALGESVAADAAAAVTRALGQDPLGVATILMRLVQDFSGPNEPRPLKWLNQFFSVVDARAPAERFAIMWLANDAAPKDSVALRGFMVDLLERLRDQGAGQSEAVRASILVHLGNRYSALGQRAAALTATLAAVDLYRGLADAQPDAQPDALNPDLAMSLTNLGEVYSALGQREEALKATLAAVDIYRGLAAVQPDAFTPDLAMSLNNLGAVYSALGQRAVALTATLEAVVLRRGLADAQPDAFTPALANSLNNLGNGYRDLGQREEALTATLEAVDLYRALAAAQPDAFTPDLAMSLNNLGEMYSALGQRAAALTAASEAVGLYRDLAAAQPDAFTPDLAMSLNNLGAMYSALGQRAAALTATSEAVDLYRRLAAAQPDAFRPRLANSLSNLGQVYSALGQREAALAATLEAVDIYRALAAARPDAFTPDLALGLNNLGNWYGELGQREEALKATSAAVDLYRDLAAAQPDAFTPDLAMSLNNLGIRYSALGRREEALKATSAAVDLYRDLADAQPDAFTPDLAMSLNNLGAMYSELGQRAAALTATLEAVALRRGLAAAESDAFTPNLATSLSVLGMCYLTDGDSVAAAEAFAEGIQRLTPYFAAHPAAFTEPMSALLGKYLTACDAADRVADEDLLAPVAAVFAGLEPSAG